jgi:aldehyde dehydrogenase (NAD+)
MEGSIREFLIPGKENRVYRDPVGVVGAITPWNWSFIATGNSVVLKLDEQTLIPRTTYTISPREHCR